MFKLTWERGKNPYRFNRFGKLGLGPGQNRKQIRKRANDLAAALRNGNRVELDGTPLTEHDITDASTGLDEVEARIGELALVHDRGQHQPRASDGIAMALQEKASLPAGPIPLPLAHPAAMLTFVPEPRAELIPEPELRELGLVDATDPADLACDIIFDE